MHSATSHKSDHRTTAQSESALDRDLSAPASRRIQLSARGIALFLCVITLIFIVLAIIGQYARWQYGIENNMIFMFDLEAEKNAPTLFSGLIMLLAALIVWVIQRQDPVRTTRRKWQVLGAGMFLMSVDEVFRIHERPTDTIRDMLGGGDLGMFTYAWVIPALILLPFIGLYFLSFLKSLPRETAIGFLLAGFLFVGGSVGLEMVGGWYFAESGRDGILSIIAMIEEACEFFGICLFIYVALRYLAEHVQWAELRFRR